MSPKSVRTRSPTMTEATGISIVGRGDRSAGAVEDLTVGVSLCVGVDSMFEGVGVEDLFGEVGGLLLNAGDEFFLEGGMLFDEE